MQYQFIKDNKNIYRVDEMCECLDLLRGSYYSWESRAPSDRSKQDEVLKDRISELHRKAKGRYGHRPIYSHLQDDDFDCGRDRTLRLMQELGIAGVQRKGFKPLGTDSNHNFGYSANLLKQLGKPERLDQVWVADTTYLRIEGGWCYLATVMDLFSRRILGWSVSDHNDSKLVCQALQAAVLTRGGDLPKGLIHHSDRGSTYASYAYADMLSSFGIEPSMSAKGNCYDNAAQESFYGRYKTSSVRGRIFADQQEARSNAFEYIEVFYNRFRKHSSLGYQSPFQFEEKFCPHGGKQQASLPACLSHN
ncbi:IS3 family transposase [Coraliomargarita sp. SDUM461003]|uniref:IS3 family transposase n=1 Tax=Thalassobacterium maritimum TaxID=3041265 RepID=A0ABU1AP02_9BACT|nr:IS3 family transposase [Coraliomargarita sp. SDUM461003]MDQ8205902.1 IS3 family transposase [Coraliomargarita sp. SDUM461003]